jgi:signal transduction histidine kinase
VPSSHDRPDAEREQTDQSLREERAQADGAPAVDATPVEEVADAVINRARALADELLAAARAKVDRQASGHPPNSVERKRDVEDEVVRSERAEADEKLRVARAEHVALLNVGREETDKDLLSERSRADAAIAMRDEFLGIVSHDLRNLLNNMVLSASVITEGVKEADHVEQVLKLARRILSAGARMNRLIGDLVDVASIDAGALEVTREPQDPTVVVTEAVQAFQAQAAAKEVSLVCELVPGQLLAAFDSTRILQVLGNLLGNAIKFTPAKGQVLVCVKLVDDEVRFTVADNGPGIPEDQLTSIFDRYSQVTKNDRRGVGLGLYISKCIVRSHEGRLWAESELGHGTTGVFTLPSMPTTAASAAATSAR